MGLGFNPLYAAGLCLIANTAPVAFGALGIPITVAGKVTGTDPFLIGQMAGRQLPLLSLFVPFWLVFIMDGWRGVRETWPAIFVAAAAFAVTQYFTSNHWAYELPDITSALVSLVVLTLFLRFVWQPQQDFAFQGAGGGGISAAEHRSQSQYSLGQIVKAWSPFIVLTIMVTIWTLPSFKALFAKGAPLEAWVMSFHIPGLDKLVMKGLPIVKALTPYEAVYKFDVLSATGTSILLAAVISAFILGVNVKLFFVTFWETLVELARPIFTIGLVLGFAFIANYSGASSTLGLAFAATGALFPLLLAVPGLAWRVPDRLRHLQQRAVRQLAASHGATDRRRSDPDHCRQHHRRRHRQDDFAAVHRSRLRRDRTGGQGIGSVPLYAKTQPVLCHHYRRHHLCASVLPAMDDSGGGAVTR